MAKISGAGRRLRANIGGNRSQRPPRTSSRRVHRETTEWREPASYVLARLIFQFNLCGLSH